MLDCGTMERKDSGSVNKMERPSCTWKQLSLVVSSLWLFTEEWNQINLSKIFCEWCSETFFSFQQQVTSTVRNVTNFVAMWNTLNSVSGFTCKLYKLQLTVSQSEGHANTGKKNHDTIKHSLLNFGGNTGWLISSDLNDGNNTHRNSCDSRKRIGGLQRSFLFHGCHTTYLCQHV
jgi:hypothetical protein